MISIFVLIFTLVRHKNIITYENRPFADADEMDKALISNWNSIVGKDDKVFVLGDVSFGSKERAIENVQQLNGHKTLILGNHDRSRSISFWNDAGFEVVIPYPIIYKEYIVMMHEPPTYFNENTPYFHIYGHVHSTPDYKDHTYHSACVSIGRLNYHPALLEDVVSGKAYEWRNA